MRIGSLILEAKNCADSAGFDLSRAPGRPYKTITKMPAIERIIPANIFKFGFSTFLMKIYERRTVKRGFKPLEIGVTIVTVPNMIA